MVVIVAPAGRPVTVVEKIPGCLRDTPGRAAGGDHRSATACVFPCAAIYACQPVEEDGRPMTVGVGKRGDEWQGRCGPALPARVVLFCVLALIAGCGPTAQGQPVPVVPSPPESGLPAPPQATDVVQIYLVRDDRLVAVPRTGRSVSDAVAALTAGPTPLDVETGLGSAVLARSVRLAGSQTPDVVTVEVTPEFAGLLERERFLAAAQLVWTVTEVCCATQVRVQLDTRPLPVPTDAGPVERPVRRDDYLSVGAR